MVENFETHASNERTFLAWVRTAVAIVGFGLAAARLAPQPTTSWSELPMLVAGALLIVIAWLLFMFVIAALLGLIPSGIASFLAVTLGYVRRFRRRHGDKLARLHEPSASDPPTSP